MLVKLRLLLLLIFFVQTGKSQECIQRIQQIRATVSPEKKALLLNRYLESSCTDSIADLTLHVVGTAYLIQPENPFGLMLMDRALPRVPNDHRLYLLRGDLLVKKEQLPMAEADYRKGLSLAPASDTLSMMKCRVAIAGVLLDQALRDTVPEANNRRYTEAVEQSGWVLSRDSNHLQALDMQSVALYNSRQYAESVPVFERRVTLRPNDQELMGQLALACRYAGKKAGESEMNVPLATYFLYKSYQYNPNAPETLRLLGVAYGMSGQHEEAVQWFRKASTLAPEDASIWQALSTAYGLSGKKHLMKKYRKKARKLQPSPG
jgi:Flp pilus assembly protein TadD